MGTSRVGQTIFWFWMLALGLLARPSAAGDPWLAVGYDGRHVAARTSAGEIVVYRGPGSILARRRFAGDLLSLAVSPHAPLLAVLRREQGTTLLQTWDYALDELSSAAPAVAAAARSVSFSGGGHALLLLAAPEPGEALPSTPPPALPPVPQPAGAAAPTLPEVGDQPLAAGSPLIRVLGAEDLGLRRVIPLPELRAPETLPSFDLAFSPRDWHLAVAGPRLLVFGGSGGTALTSLPVDLAADGPVAVRFTPDGRHVVAGGDGGLVVAPVSGRNPWWLPLTGANPSSAFCLGPDGRFAYLADGPRLHAVRLGTGGIDLSLDLRESAGAVPLSVVSSEPWQAVVILFADGELLWCQPWRRELLVRHQVGDEAVPAGGPARPTVGPAAPVSPGAGPEPGPGPATNPGPEPTAPPQSDLAAAWFTAIGQLLAAEGVFVEDGPLRLFVLDADYQRIPALEDAAQTSGWTTLVLGLVAISMDRQDLLPPELRTLARELRQVELLDAKSVTFGEGVQPAYLEQIFGPAEDTGQRVIVGDGQTLPLHRFGPFTVPVQAGRVPARTSLQLRVPMVRRFAGTD